MNRIWANRLEAGTKVWEQVPIERRDAVKQILYDDVPLKISAERYEEITGEPYIPTPEPELVCTEEGCTIESEE